MDRAAFDTFCGSLKATSHIEQWGGASVWKIGGKIFALCSRWGSVPHQCVSFKCSDLTFQILCEQDGIVPAPYLARAKWVQIEDPDVMSDDDLLRYIETAYWIVAGKLTRAQRKSLAIELPEKS